MKNHELQKDDYKLFYEETLYSRRYVHTKRVNAFLDIFRDSIRNNYIQLYKGNVYYRAQNGCLENEKRKKEPYKKERMFPLKRQAREGRINPKGIPYLYLTESIDNALFEIGSNYKSYVSIGRFVLKRNIQVVCFYNLLLNFWPELIISDKSSPSVTVWNEINQAFAKPIKNTDQTAEYVPTQVFAEIIKDEGFDGILYMNAYYECYNLCLFNVDDASLRGINLKYIRSKYYEHD